MDVPQRIEVDSGAALLLTWPDGSVTTVAAPALRAACECATCLGPEGNNAWIGDAATVRIVNASLVGAYAINFTFAPDDHHTGIYPFDRLRALGEAAAAREA
jgi:DUF971 family protein